MLGLYNFCIYFLASLDVEFVTFEGFGFTKKEWQCGPFLFSKLNLGNLRT